MEIFLYVNFLRKEQQVSPSNFFLNILTLGSELLKNIKLQRNKWFILTLGLKSNIGLIKQEKKTIVFTLKMFSEKMHSKRGRQIDIYFAKYFNKIKTITIAQGLQINLARVSLTIVGCFEWEALLQRYIHVQNNKIKRKQFRTKGKGGKWKVEVEVKGIEE